MDEAKALLEARAGAPKVGRRTRAAKKSATAPRRKAKRAAVEA
jgi:hypothetical protein